MVNTEIKAHDKFRHFKGDIMEVICVGKHSETLEEMVVYTHGNEIWIRPVSMFLSTEDVSGRSDNVTGQKYRFEKIEN